MGELNMISTLKADFYRIFKSSLGFYSVAGLVVVGIAFGFLASSDNTPQLIIQSGLSNGALLIPVFLTNIFMISWGHEFSYRVVNNSLISGMKRSTFFASKTILTFLLTILFIGVYATSLMITTWALKGGFSLSAALKPLLAQLPLYLAASSLGILLFNGLKASYISVAAFISLAFVGDTIFSNIISTYFAKFDFILDTLFFSNLRMVTDLSALSSSQVQTIFISSAIYAALALLISFRLFKNREFK